MKIGDSVRLDRWWTRTMVGGALGVALGSSPGCYFQDENFVDDFAVEVCRLTRECDGALTLPNRTEPLPTGDECEGQVEAHYLTCGERCDYQAHKARRCLRRIRDNECPSSTTVSGNEVEITIPIVCDEVYVGCEGDDAACRAPSCAVVGSGRGSDFGWALGLVALGAFGRRRRRVS